MEVIIIYIIGLWIYWHVPMSFKYIWFMFEVLIPDPVPLVEEIIMFIMIRKKWSALKKIGKK